MTMIRSCITRQGRFQRHRQKLQDRQVHRSQVCTQSHQKMRLETSLKEELEAMQMLGPNKWQTYECYQLQICNYNSEICVLLLNHAFSQLLQNLDSISIVYFSPNTITSTDVEQLCFCQVQQWSRQRSSKVCQLRARHQLHTR